MKMIKKIAVLFGAFLLLNTSLFALPSIRSLEKNKSQSVTAKNNAANYSTDVVPDAVYTQLHYYRLMKSQYY